MTTNTIRYTIFAATLVILGALLSACQLLPAVGVGNQPGSTPGTSVPQPGAGDFVRGLATVDRIEILLLESFPVQVDVRVSGWLADSCTTLERTVVDRQERTFDVTIFTTRPTEAVCAQELKSFEELISLDVLGLTAGEYVVDVNGERSTFNLAVDNLPVVENASIYGMVWHDLCAVGGGEGGAPLTPTSGCVRSTAGDNAYVANGVLEAGEPGIGGVQINLGAGVCPATGLQVAATDSAGAFAFVDLAPGTYCVSIEPMQGANTAALVPGGWTYPVEALNRAVASYSVTLTAGEARNNLNFGWDYQFLPAPPVVATPTPVPTAVPTQIPVPCERAGFVKDVTVLDGTDFAPGAAFTKTWRLQNTGSCTWDTSYALVFVNGTAMNASKVVPLRSVVRPGDVVDLSVDLVAPDKPGDYQGFWQLRNGSGKLFGLGSNADKAFWVKIKVSAPRKVAYHFAEKMCEATWQSGAGVLPCPGSGEVANGFVQRLDAPKLENGTTENEPTLYTHPQMVTDGMISGTYPAFKVKSGDQFKASIGCLQEAVGCDVMFQLNYRVDGGSLKNLGTWTEVYDGRVNRVKVDLTPLAGKSVQFVLTVLANGSADNDQAFWHAPAIVR